MRSLCLSGFGLALRKTTASSSSGPASSEVLTGEGIREIPRIGTKATIHRALCPQTALLLSALFFLAVAPGALAQNWKPGQHHERTFADSYAPLVYPVRNSGMHFRAPIFPSFAKLPIVRPLPDPFQFFDGYRDTSLTSWERHRNQIMAAIEKYEIGPVPNCHDCIITAHYTPPAAGSSIGSLTVHVTRHGKTLTLTSGIYIPQGMGSGPFPAIIPMEIASFSFGGQAFNFPPPTPPDYGSLPASVFQGLPIATVGYVSTQVAEYSFTSPSNHTMDPFYQLYPKLCEGVCTGGSNSGEYAAWSWGVSRLIDGMEIATHQAVNPLPINMKRLAVTGCSFAGKMALFAGAFDERIALTIAQESGGGGATSWRVSHEIEAPGTVEDIDDTNYDWFDSKMKQFAGNNVYKLPVDQDELMGMVAPRALLETGNTEFYWLSNGSNYVAARATQRIYNTLGIGDRFGFYIDGNHGHCATLPAEAPVIKSFVEKFLLGNENTNTDVQVYPNPADTVNYGYPIVVSNGNYAYYFPKMNYRRWTDWWGTNDPVFPDSWDTGGTIVMSLHRMRRFKHFHGYSSGLHSYGRNFPGHLWVSSGDTVSGGYQLAMGGKHPSATVSLVSGANITVDISCQGGNSYTLTIPLSAKSYSIAADDQTPMPSRSEAFQGSITATPPSGASACVAGRVTNAYFSATGLSENGDGSPGGPGLLTTDVKDPLFVRFHVLDSTTGHSSFYSPWVAVQWNPLTSADSTNQNPVKPTQP